MKEDLELVEPSQVLADYSFIPQSRDTLLTKRYSTCSNSQIQRVTKHSAELELEEITGYVTCIHQSLVAGTGFRER